MAVHIDPGASTIRVNHDARTTTTDNRTVHTGAAKFRGASAAAAGQRRRQVRLLARLGATRRQLGASFGWQAAFVTVVGVAAGAVVCGGDPGQPRPGCHRQCGALRPGRVSGAGHQRRGRHCGRRDHGTIYRDIPPGVIFRPPECSTNRFWFARIAESHRRKWNVTISKCASCDNRRACITLRGSQITRSAKSQQIRSEAAGGRHSAVAPYVRSVPVACLSLFAHAFGPD